MKNTTATTNPMLVPEQEMFQLIFGNCIPVGSTLVRLRKQVGALPPAVKVFKRYFYNLETVVAWIKEKEGQATA